MSSSTPIIAIDDEPDDLAGLANGLSRYGVPCYKIHFTGLADIQACPEVRVIFADLNLGAGGLASGDFKSNFSSIGRILEKIQPRGPYVVFLWTWHAARAPELKTFLRERLEGIPKPFDIRSVEKADHLDGTEIRSEQHLVEQIASLTEELGEAGGYDDSYRVVKAALAPLFRDRVGRENPEAGERFSSCPIPDEIRDRLNCLFAKPEGPSEQMPPGYPTVESELEDWLDAVLADFGKTPRQMLQSDERDDLFFLDRFVNAIATSRVASHPNIVRDIVRKRIETMFRDGLPLGLIRGPEMPPVDEERTQAFERWMNAVNLIFGDITPQQFFNSNEINVERLRVISSRLDAIDDGAFS